MTTNIRFFTSLALLALTLTGCATSAAVENGRDQADVRKRVELLLERYAANDQDRVTEMLDPSGVTVLGTDLGEVIHTPAQLRALMDADFRLWVNAKFSDVRDFDFRGNGSMASAFFVVSFSAGGGPPIPIRINTTWRKKGGIWYLTQSANSVPTVGQSAVR